MKQLEIPIKGMDCAECASHVEHALKGVRGVENARVLLAAEKAFIEYQEMSPERSEIQKAVKAAGYEVGDYKTTPHAEKKNFSLALTGVFLLVFLVVILGEVFGWLDMLASFLPWFVWLALILLGGFPIFRNVLNAARNGKIISHSLMTMGVIAAILVGEWPTAAVVVVFMRVGDFVEGLTTDKARDAVRDLYKLAPLTARVEKDGKTREIPIDRVQESDVVIVQPGESIPVDGVVIYGKASVDQAAITGESMPISVSGGEKIFSASIVQNGMLKIRTTAVGMDTRFGQVIQLVEEAELNRGDVQLLADRFAGIYLPIVAGIAILTFLFRGDILAAAAVLVVACSCSFSLATPIAMLASIGSAAKQGILIKGGKYIEELAKVDTVFVDKTGTLTVGRPTITDIVPLGKLGKRELLSMASSVEKYASHPLADAVLQKAGEEKVVLIEPEDFQDNTGGGPQAVVNGQTVQISREMDLQQEDAKSIIDDLRASGKTLFFISVDGKPAGVMAAEDEAREETARAIQDLREMGLAHIVLLSGDRESAVQQVANKLGIEYRAELLPDEKIAIVRAAQEKGQKVVMVGDGINDAPALAQADVGIAMGAGGSDIAIEAAHITLLRDDWSLVPLAFRTARRTLGIVRTNILFTALYNFFGLSLAALGILPPVYAAALQSLPDIGILANSARLIRSK